MYDAGEIGRNYAKTPLYGTTEFITTAAEELIQVHTPSQEEQDNLINRLTKGATWLGG